MKVWIQRSAMSLALAAIVLVGCEATTTTTTTVVVTAPLTATTQAPPTTSQLSVGSPENPIEILFVPSVGKEAIVSRGDLMVTALEDATGLKFELSTYGATIERMCADPDRTIGFIPGIGYVLANDLCGVDVSFKAVRFGYDSYWGEFLVPRDSEISSLTDLAGLRWAYPGPGSAAGYMVPLLELHDAGAEPGPTIDVGDHAEAALAVYRGDADFATAFFIPPLGPERTWQPGDEPDIPEHLTADCKTAYGGPLWCGGYRALDARTSAAAEAPDIVQSIRILQTEGIPNDTLSFGPDFSPQIRARVEEAIAVFALSSDWEQSIGSQDFYGWSALARADDSDYDRLREVVSLLGLGIDNL